MSFFLLEKFREIQIVGSNVPSKVQNINMGEIMNIVHQAKSITFVLKNG